MGQGGGGGVWCRHQARGAAPAPPPPPPRSGRCVPSDEQASSRNEGGPIRCTAGRDRRGWAAARRRRGRWLEQPVRRAAASARPAATPQRRRPRALDDGALPHGRDGAGGASGAEPRAPPPAHGPRGNARRRDGPAFAERGGGRARQGPATRAVTQQRLRSSVAGYRHRRPARARMRRPAAELEPRGRPGGRGAEQTGPNERRAICEPSPALARDQPHVRLGGRVHGVRTRDFSSCFQRCGNGTSERRGGYIVVLSCGCGKGESGGGGPGRNLAGPVSVPATSRVLCSSVCRSLIAGVGCMLHCSSGCDCDRIARLHHPRYKPS
jgi:hypothetical protein